MEQIGMITANMQTGDMDFSYKPETPEERAQRRVDDYNAGTGELNQEDGYDCPICKNKGHVAYVGEKDAFGWPAEYFKPCKCCKVRNAIRRLNRSGLKNVVKEMTFDKYEARDSWQQAIKDTAQRFCQANDGSWFFIGGQSGAGKTHICTAIAVHYIRQGKEVRYMVWPKEIQTIQALVNDADKYASLMKDIQEADVLYIDDLFKHGKDEFGKVKMPTAPEVRRAFEIINHRYNNPGLVTIISSERTLFDLDDIDEAVAGRIAQRSNPGGYCVNLKHDKRKNWRMQGVLEL